MKYSSMVRLLPYPCLEEGNQSYSSGSYDPILVFRSEFELDIQHPIQSAPFVEEAIQRGWAHFGCLVCVSAIAYRKLYTCDEPTQTIQLDKDITSGARLLFQAVVVSNKEIKHKFTAKDGVDEFHHNHLYIFPKGARLARGPYHRSRGPSGRRLELIKDRELSPGSFKVNLNTKYGGIFDVRASPDLWDFLKLHKHANPGQHSSIVTHILHECFIALHKSSQDENGDQDEIPSNFKALGVWMEKNDCTPWWEKDFDPLKAVIKARRHKPSIPDKED